MLILILPCYLQPSLAPTTSPSQSPTQSVPPSYPPTEEEVMESSIIISQSNGRSSTQLLIVGAACLIVIASTSAYLYKRGSGQHKRKRPPAQIEVSSPKHGGLEMVSPYSIENNLSRVHPKFNVNYSESESRISSSDTYEYIYAAKNKCNENNGGLVDIDLENGRVDMDDVPNSVSIIKMVELSNAGKLKPGGNGHDNETPGSSKLRMPKSIYVPKLFQRTKEREENTKENMTWNQIREEDRSPASSGYAPASVPSPMLSPFFVKGLSSLYAGIGKKGGFLHETNSIEMDGDTTDDVNGKSSDKQSIRKGGKRGVVKSTLKEVVVKRDNRSPGSDVFADLDNGVAQDYVGDRTRGQTNLRTAVSRSSDGSSIEWGIDVSKVPGAFEANMAELQNLFVSIKSMGTAIDDKSTSPKSEVQMTYTEDSWETDGTFLANIAPIESSSTHSTSVRSFHSPSHEGLPKTQNGSGITYERELLNANRMNCEGISFRNIFNDPKNDLYECHVPSGPLGIVVDTTSLGPRVRSLNPLSPLFGKICPGDVVVGVDEVDTVGMEAGDFWQIVSRKANQQQRILTILRI